MTDEDFIRLVAADLVDEFGVEILATTERLLDQRASKKRVTRSVGVEHLHFIADVTTIAIASFMLDVVPYVRKKATGIVDRATLKTIILRTMQRGKAADTASAEKVIDSVIRITSDVSHG